MQEHTAIMSRAHNTGEHRPHQDREREVNVGDSERWLSLIGGSALALYGLRRSLWGLALMVGGGIIVYRGMSGHCPLYKALGIDTVGSDSHTGIRLTETLTINKPREDVYRFWRHLENVPRFMTHLESVTTTGSHRSHWVAKVPMHTSLVWDAEITEERANEHLSWHSLPGADVEHTGTVYFRRAPGGRGTEVQVTLEYRPPGGVAGAAVARLLKSITAQQIKEDLRRLKQILEAGEYSTTTGQPAGSAYRA